MGGNTGEIQLGSELELYKYINHYDMQQGHQQKQVFNSKIT